MKQKVGIKIGQYYVKCVTPNFKDENSNELACYPCHPDCDLKTDVCSPTCMPYCNPDCHPENRTCSPTCMPYCNPDDFCRP